MEIELTIDRRLAQKAQFIILTVSAILAVAAVLTLSAMMKLSTMLRQSPIILLTRVLLVAWVLVRGRISTWTLVRSSTIAKLSMMDMICRLRAARIISTLAFLIHAFSTASMRFRTMMRTFMELIKKAEDARDGMFGVRI